MLTPRTSEFCTMLNTPACSTFQSRRLLKQHLHLNFSFQLHYLIFPGEISVSVWMMDARPAQYSGGRGAPPAPSKSIHQEILPSVGRNVHRATCRLQQKFYRHIQN